jgi:hypothetical protein
MIELLPAAVLLSIVFTSIDEVLEQGSSVRVFLAGIRVTDRLFDCIASDAMR